MPTLLEEDNHFISPAAAKAMTEYYMAEKENILAEEYQNQDILCRCETFNRAAFEALLAETECEGIRIYFAMDQNMKIRTIIVGVNGSNEDILPPDQNWESSPNKIVESGRPCPEYCPSEPL